MDNQQQPTPQPLLISVEGAANLLQIGRTAAWELVRKKKIASVKIGRTRRIPMTAIYDYVTKLLEGEAA